MPLSFSELEDWVRLMPSRAPSPHTSQAPQGQQGEVHGGPGLPQRAEPQGLEPLHPTAEVRGEAGHC